MAIDFDILSESFNRIFEELDAMKLNGVCDEANYVHVSQALARVMMMFHILDNGHAVIEY